MENIGKRAPWLGRLALCAALILEGCGGDSGSNPLSGYPSSNPATETSTLVARVYLGAEVDRAVVTLQDSNGAVIAQKTTDNSGLAVFEGVASRLNAKVSASLPNSSETFRTYLINFDPANEMAEINLLTDLTARYLEAHPGGGVAEAESRVKVAAGLRPDFQFHFNEPFNDFSTPSMLRAAAKQGGWSNFAQKFVQRAEHPVAAGPILNAETIPFHYSPNPVALNQSETGLDTGLDQIAERARRLAKPYFRFRPPARFEQPVLIGWGPAGPSSMLGQTILGLSTGVTGNILTGGTVIVTKIGYGVAVEQLGLNYGTSGQLRNIQDSLDALTNMVKDLTSKAGDQALKSNLVALQQSFASVQTATGTLNNDSFAAANGSLPSNLPYNTFERVGLKNEVETAANITLNNLAHSDLTGGGGYIRQFQTAFYLQRLGVDSPDRYQGAPWRTNQVSAEVLEMFTSYGSLQTMNLNLLSETAHSTFPNAPNPALIGGGLFNLGVNIDNSIAQVKLQRQTLPLPHSDYNVIVDFENGVMWNAWISPPTTFSAAQASANAYTSSNTLPDGTSVTYSDWRLPSYEEIKSLQFRAAHTGIVDTSQGIAFNSNNGEGDFGRSTLGLNTLGFRNLASAYPNSTPGKNGDTWFQNFEDKKERDGQVDFLDDYYFRLNHENSDYSQDTHDRRPYIMCRTFGPKWIYATPAPYDNNADIARALAGSDFAEGEFAQWGTPTSMYAPSIRVATTAQAQVNIPLSDGSVSTLQLPDQTQIASTAVNYTLNVGGPMSCGNSTVVQAPYPPQSPQTYLGSALTDNRSTGQPNELANLYNWSINAADQSIARVLNAPYISGFIIPYTSQTFRLTLSALGAGASVKAADAVQAEASVRAGISTPRVLQSIKIGPRNQIYGQVKDQPATGGGPYNYYLIGYYSDQTVADLTETATWSIVADQGHPNTSNASFAVGSGAASLDLNEPPQSDRQANTYNLTIKASVGNVTDSTLMQVIPPAP